MKNKFNIIMKSIKTNILLALTIGVIAFSSCTKDDGAIKKKITINDVPTITTPIDASGSQAINMLNLAAFSGKFKSELYFAGSTPPTKVDIVVRKNGSASNVKVYKAGVTTLPASFTVTAAEIATLFGTPIVLGDTYDFAPDIYVGDRKFEAFPLIGSGTGVGVAALPLFSEFARFAAICAYDPAIYEGNFVVISDGFGDFAPGDVVVVTKITNTQFSFMPAAGSVTAPLPIIVNVNVLNNQLTITKQKIGNVFTWNTTYTNPNVAVAASTASFVAPCSKTIDLNIAYTVDQGSFGNFLLKLRKQ